MGGLGRRAAAYLVTFTILTAAPAPLRGTDSKHKDKPGKSYSIVAGTVFRDPGFALAGARITMTPAPDANSPAKTKTKKSKAISDSRGEFAFRVPAVAMRYMISVEADGYAPQQKPVEVQGGERAEVYFSLQPAASR